MVGRSGYIYQGEGMDEDIRRASVPSPSYHRRSVLSYLSVSPFLLSVRIYSVPTTYFYLFFRHYYFCFNYFIIKRKRLYRKLHLLFDRDPTVVSCRMRCSMRLIVLLGLIAVSLGAPQKCGDLDCLIDSIYTPKSPTGSNGGVTPSPINNGGQIPESGGGEDDCECVPYYQCQNNTIVTEGIGLIDIRVKGACDNYLDICCKKPDVLKPEDKVTPKPPVRRGCGQRNPDGVGFRITGHTDNEAQFGEFPWMVAVLREEIIGQNAEKLNVYQCGGALIHPEVVLTAAHCVNGKQPSQLKVRAGEWDTQTKNEVYPHQDRNVKSVVVHEGFHSGALYNDVALLILETAVNLAENVDLTCLPAHGETFDGTRCFASGWGKDIFGKEGHYQVILKRVDLPIVPHDVCQSSLRTTRLGKYFNLHSSFVCAGGESGKDTCKGDGGSPLVCPLKNDPSRYAQVGIVAWGIGCGENRVPGVYANVAAARHWIDEQMVYNNLDINTYQA